MNSEPPPSRDAGRGTPVWELRGPLNAQRGRLAPLVGRSHMTAPVSVDDVRGVERSEFVELVGLQVASM